MKKVLPLTVFMALVFSACEGFQEDPRDQSYEIRTAAKYRSMVTVVPVNKTATVSGAGISGVFVADRAVILGAYSIAKYETTWELWKEVYDWAAGHGYSIANTGTEGHGEANGTGGVAWAAASRRTRPVTGISWTDAVIWCNAYSELSGLEAVYYKEGGGVLRAPPEDDGGPEAKRDRNGFRLPLETEWEFAARGGATLEDDWNIYDYAGSNNPNGVAWYAANAAVPDKPAYGAHPVGTKTANRLGIFDLSGNTAEWCWDWRNENPVTQETPPDGPASGLERVIRGGGWRSENSACTVKARAARSPYGQDTTLGFRVVRTIPDTGEIENSGDYLPTLTGTHWYWDSPWGLREIDFDTDDHATFTDPAEPPCIYSDSYTYDPALGRGTISGPYPAGDFQLRNKNKTMYIPQFRHFGHSVEFTLQE
jgi:formylglycine-generating enzyme required for sulfatase activity